MRTIREMLFVSIGLLSAVTGEAADPLSVSISPESDQTIKMGEGFNLSCTPSGGCPPYTYTWNIPLSSSPTSTKKNPGNVTYGMSADGRVCSVNMMVKDSKGAEAYESIKVYVVKVEVSVPSSLADEAADSGEYEIKVKPEMLHSSATFQFIAEAGTSWPNEAGNNPELDYASPTQNKSTVKKTQWFAMPNNRKKSVTGVECNYKVHGEATVNEKTVRSRIPAELNVTVNFIGGEGGRTYWPYVAGMVALDEREVNGNTEWYVSGMGGLVRFPPLVENYMAEQSDFRNKVQVHEDKHKDQWISGMRKDLFKPQEVYNATLSSLADSTKQGLTDKVNNAINSYNAAQSTIAHGNSCDAEKEAWTASNAVAPDYLEKDMDEVCP